MFAALRKLSNVMLLPKPPSPAGGSPGTAVIGPAVLPQAPPPSIRSVFVGEDVARVLKGNGVRNARINSHTPKQNGCVEPVFPALGDPLEEGADPRRNARPSWPRPDSTRGKKILNYDGSSRSC